MTVRHVVTTSFEGERAYWECSCGRSGACAAYDADYRSDQHIPRDEQRADRHD